MQANGGRDEELDPGMERGGWARPLFDNEAMTFVNQMATSVDMLPCLPSSKLPTSSSPIIT
jgi:hypothetical protein